jgi:hypothetical protein
MPTPLTQEEQKSYFASQGGLAKPMSPTEYQASLTPPPTGSTVTADQLQPNPTLTVPPPVTTPTSTPDLSAFIADIQKQTAPDPTLEASRTAQESLIGSFASMGGKVEDRAQAQQDTGFIEKQNALNTLGREGQMLQAESDTLSSRLNKEAKSRGDIVTRGGLAPLQSDQERDLAVRTRFWAARYAVAQNNFAMAEQQVNQAVDDRYSDKEAKINNARAQLDYLQKKIDEGTVRADKTTTLALTERKRILDQQQEEVKNKKEDDKTIFSWALVAKKNGASDYVVNQISQAQDLKSALALYSPYAVDKNEAIKAVAELEQTRAQTRLIDANINKVNAEADKTKKESVVASKMASIDPNSKTFTLDMIRASAGGKIPTGEQTKPINKASLVLSQLGELQANVSKASTGPILGILRDNNPYDVKAQLIKAQLQAITPNLARGIYGEVGVLTDNDIANYIQTLPNLKKPEEANKLILGMTLRVVKNSIDSQLQVLSAEGRDVSKFEPIYTRLEKQIATIEGGVVKTEASFSSPSGKTYQLPY